MYDSVSGATATWSGVFTAARLNTWTTFTMCVSNTAGWNAQLWINEVSQGVRPLSAPIVGQDTSFTTLYVARAYDSGYHIPGLWDRVAFVQGVYTYDSLNRALGLTLPAAPTNPPTDAPTDAPTNPPTQPAGAVGGIPTSRTNMLRHAHHNKTCTTASEQESSPTYDAMQQSVSQLDRSLP